MAHSRCELFYVCVSNVLMRELMFQKGQFLLICQKHVATKQRLELFFYRVAVQFNVNVQYELFSVQYELFNVQNELFNVKVQYELSE